MMTYEKISKESVKKYAEVFTPPGVVLMMILQEGIRPMLRDVDKTILDPAVGEGQFPCLELVWKIFYQIGNVDEETVLSAARSLYGIDIQPSSVAKTKNHLIQTACDAYKFFTGRDFTATDKLQKIVDENIICGDSLKIMRDWSNPQMSLF